LDRRVLASRIELSLVISTDEDFEMKAFVAACIAAGILWGADVKLNDGRYATSGMITALRGDGSTRAAISLDMPVPLVDDARITGVYVTQRSGR
jgi:hypothetical protein